MCDLLVLRDPQIEGLPENWIDLNENFRWQPDCLRRQRDKAKTLFGRADYRGDSNRDLADLQDDTQRRALLRSPDKVPSDRRHGFRVACNRHRNMPVAGNLATGRIEAFPAGTRQIDLGPGVRRGITGVASPSEQISADKATGKAQVAACLSEQCGEIPAGTTTLSQGRARRLDALLLANLVGKPCGYAPVDAVK